MNRKTQKKYMQCECGDISHLMIFQYDSQYKQLNVSNQLNHYLPWYKRVIHAFRYVFKFRDKYDSDWDSSVFHKDKINQIASFINNAAEDTNKIEPVITPVQQIQ